MNPFYTNIIKLVLMVLCLSTGIATVSGQVCPAIVVSGTATAPAACPSGGGITITASGAGLTYRILTGPAGFLATSNNTGIFSGLLAGTYLLEVKDNCANTVSVNATVNNTYAAFSVSAGATANICTSGVAGGTVSFSVTGGRPPYQYDVVPVAGTPVYGANTAATSGSEVVTAFGTYRIYAKDACGEVRTRDVLVQQSQPRPSLWWLDLKYDRPCAEILDGLGTVSLQLHFMDQNSSGIDVNNLIGSTIQVYKPNPANSITSIEENGWCTVAVGGLLSTTTIVAGNINPADVYTYPVTIPREDVIVIITTRCGDQLKICYDYNYGDPDTPDVKYAVIQNSCGGSWNAQDIYIVNNGTFGLKEPITYLLTKNGGGTVTNMDGYFYSLRPSHFPVTIRATDACGRVVNKTLTLPVQGSALQLLADAEWSYTCTNAQNAVSAYLHITGGDLAGLAEATSVVITGGPPAVVPGISAYMDWIPGYIASNLRAGYSYKVVITSLCNEKDSVLFTVPADLWGQNPLSWNLQTTVNQLCGQNRANISAVSNYSGTQPVAYSIYNQLAPNTAISSNSTGLFNNIPSGNYKLKFQVDASSSECPSNFIRDSVILTVIGDAVGQAVTNKTILACDSAGTVSSRGAAIIEVNGAAPFTYEIIKASLISTPSEIWTVSSTNNFSNTFSWNIPLTGDPSNTIYTLRSTDKCGNKITTMAALQPLTPPAVTNDIQPCEGALNYTTGLVPYAGAFTYRWVKLPDTITTISTSPQLVFAGPYLTSYNGVYRCYVSYGAGCLNRQVDMLLNSIFCGSVLPVKLLHFGGYEEAGRVHLDWQATNEQQLNGYTVEQSADGARFATVATVAVQPGTSAGHDYTFIDGAGLAAAEQVFYRLRLNHQNGTVTYSNILRFTVKAAQAIQVYPNPVQDACTLSFSSAVAGGATVRVLDKTGRVVYSNPVQVRQGANALRLQPRLPAGTYTVELRTGNEIRHAALIKL